MKNRVEIGWKEVDEDSNENGRKCRCSVTNEAIFKMGCIVITHIHAIHLLYHRVEGDLQRRDYALQYGLKYNVAVLYKQLLHLPVAVATCKKDRET